MQAHRHFSVEAANALLPMVRQAFAEVRPLHQRLVEVSAEMRARGFAPAMRPGVQIEAAASAWQSELESLAARIDGLLRPLTELGVEIKAVDGLADFPSQHHGRTVLLCWHWDEPSVGWFHEVDTGFAGRRKIEEPSAFEGDLLN